jgi:hypothetical protein
MSTEAITTTNSILNAESLTARHNSEIQTARLSANPVANLMNNGKESANLAEIPTCRPVLGN